MMPWRAAALKATTFCMTVSRWHRLCGASLPESVNEPRFPDFCTKCEKWFHAWENCFVAGFATKQRRLNCEYFQCVENAVNSGRQTFRMRQNNLGSGLLAGWREQITAASD